MSDRDLVLTGTGSDWAYVLSALLFVVGTAGLCFAIWAVIHAPLIHARRRRYRARMRAARHARPSLVRRTP